MAEIADPTITSAEAFSGEMDLRGLQRLAGAILLQAIDDIRTRGGRTGEDALRWLSDECDEHLSFVFCCRLLNRDPNEIRSVVLREVLPGWIIRSSPLTSPPDPA
jgi:hypothetical protein